MRATTIIVALGALLCLLAMAPATHHKPAMATAQSLTPEQQAALDAWLADPANAAQLNADADSDNGSDSPMGRRPQLTDARKAQIIAKAKGISQEDALFEVQAMNANVQALFEASAENAKRK
jgi:hypothetical protein